MDQGKKPILMAQMGVEVCGAQQHNSLSLLAFCDQNVTDLIVEIERLTKNQKGIGSNPSGLTKVNLCFSLIKK